LLTHRSHREGSAENDAKRFAAAAEDGRM